MLCPEVWNFPPPRTTHSVQLRAEKGDIAAAVRSHPYYHSISVVCPDEYKLPDVLLDVVGGTDGDCYRLANCPAAELLDKQFIKRFVNTGRVACLSIKRHCNVANCIAITEDGILILHVVDKLYQELGLEGKKTRRNFFEVIIDLKSEKLKGNKYFSKLKESLQKLDKFDFIIKWTPHTDEVCPSSIAKYFYDRNIDVSVSVSRVTSVRREVEQVPGWCDESVRELVEWVGMVASGADLRPKEPYVSCYVSPTSDCNVASQAAVLILHGLFTQKDILNLYDEVKKYNESRDGSHWTAMSFHSFTDAPVTQVAQAAPQFQASDATYTIFTRSSGDCIHKSLLIE